MNFLNGCARAFFPHSGNDAGSQGGIGVFRRLRLGLGTVLCFQSPRGQFHSMKITGQVCLWRKVA